MRENSPSAVEQIYYQVATIARYLTATSPMEADSHWMAYRGFYCSIPPELVRGPGVKWFSFLCFGQRRYTEFDTDTGRGRYHAELPPGVDPASVREIAMDGSASLLAGFPEMLQRLVQYKERGININLEQMMEMAANLTKLIKQGGEQERLRSVITSDAIVAVVSGSSRFVEWLQSRAEAAAERVIRCEIDGYELCGIVMLAELMQQVMPALEAKGTHERRSLEMEFMAPIASQKAPSLPELARWMVVEVCRKGYSAQVLAAAANLKKRGEQLVESALALEATDDDPTISLLNEFYVGIYRALPYLEAGKCCLKIVATQTNLDNLSESDRAALPTERNNADEKCVRALRALQFAVENLDGHCFAEHRARLRALADKKDEDAVDALLLDLTDFEYFYPRCMQARLLQ